MAPTAVMNARPHMDQVYTGILTRQRKRQIMNSTGHEDESQSPKNKIDKCDKNESEADSYENATNKARVIVIAFIGLCLYNRESIQSFIDSSWQYLRQQPYFCSAYFESVYVTVVYGLIIVLYPYAMHYISYLSKFKVKADVTYVHQTVLGIIINAVIYMAPLLAADSIIQKKYSGVPEIEWDKRNRQWIQTTRALPQNAPNFIIMCLHIAGSVIVFDALFFILHYTLHKNALLYKYIHATHHKHGALHPHVTNQLSIVERGAIVGAANYSLKLFSAHPLTRLAFVIVFLWLLVDNHTGYDLPWSPHRILPAGLMGGPAKHHAHHVNGARHFQPFFTYLDDLMDWWKSRDGSSGNATRDDIVAKRS